MKHARSIKELTRGIVMECCIPSQQSTKTPLLFVHGNFCGSWCWRNLLIYFAQRGVSCYAVNFRGHWLSAGHAALGTAITEHYVEDVEQCLAAIGTGVILFGHSMGGIVSQKVAENNPVKSLILVDSAPCREITENCFQPKPEVGDILKDLFKPLSDGTVVMERNRDMIKKILFETGNVSEETLAQATAYLGRESAHVLKNHAFISVDPQKVTCPVYVIGRTGYGNQKNPDLWHALADYYHAADRYISGDIGHCMYMEKNWQHHAARFEKWCFE